MLEHAASAIFEVSDRVTVCLLPVVSEKQVLATVVRAAISLHSQWPV